LLEQNLRARRFAVLVLIAANLAGLLTASRRHDRGHRFEHETPDSTGQSTLPQASLADQMIEISLGQRLHELG
jgi:hypothetical protein